VIERNTAEEFQIYEKKLIMIVKVGAHSVFNVKEVALISRYGERLTSTRQCYAKTRKAISSRRRFFFLPQFCTLIYRTRQITRHHRTETLYVTLMRR
jgi:hypothetical protein